MDFASIFQGGTVKSEKPTFPNYFFHGHDMWKRENRIQLHGVLSSSFHQGLQFGNQAKDEIFTFFSPSRK
jgi:hypothetical protein